MLRSPSISRKPAIRPIVSWGSLSISCVPCELGAVGYSAIDDVDVTLHTG